MRHNSISAFLRGLAQGAGFCAAIAIAWTGILVAAPLSGPWKLFESGEILEANDLNANFSALKTAVEKLPEVPVGTVLSWHKSMSGTPTLPVGWMECNGQTVSDSASPYDGQALPNLNSAPNGYNAAGYYLRGAATSGSIQEDSLQGHKHDDSGHNHGFQTFGGYESDPFQYVAHSRWKAAANLVATETGYASLTNPTATSYGSVRYGTETRPLTFTVVWIMRVK